MHLFTIHLLIILSFINHTCIYSLSIYSSFIYLLTILSCIFLHRSIYHSPIHSFTNQHIYTIHLFIYSTPIRELIFYFVYTKSFTRHSFIIRFINYSLIIKSINQHLQKLLIHKLCTFHNTF